MKITNNMVLLFVLSLVILFIVLRYKGILSFGTNISSERKNPSKLQSDIDNLAAILDQENHWSRLSRASETLRNSDGSELVLRGVVDRSNFVSEQERRSHTVSKPIAKKL